MSPELGEKRIAAYIWHGNFEQQHKNKCRKFLQVQICLGMFLWASRPLQTASLRLTSSGTSFQTPCLVHPLDHRSSLLSSTFLSGKIARQVDVQMINIPVILTKMRLHISSCLNGKKSNTSLVESVGLVLSCIVWTAGLRTDLLFLVF